VADFEPVAEALVRRLTDVGDAVMVARYRAALETLPDNPAVIVAMSDASVRPQHGGPALWTASFQIGYWARSDGGEESPESRLNAWLVALQDAMAPQADERMNTLEDTCEHAWLSGPVEFIPPTRDDPWMGCWATVEVLVVG
jgi:hypothetical protein